MRNIFDLKFTPPVTFISNSFCVFPTDSNLFESDFTAVMKSKRSLRIWSQSDWPGDEFTAEENLEDLRLHETDNKNHSAYGYMIYSPDKKTCLGSLYLNPMSTITENYEVSPSQLSELRPYEARVDYWVSEGNAELELDITRELSSWLQDEWKIKCLFSLRPGMESRLRVYQQLNFRRVMTLKGNSAGLELFSPFL